HWDGKSKIKAADYDYHTKKITVEFQALLEFLVYDLKYIVVIDRQDYGAYLYDVVVGAVLHELEHANQMVKCDMDGSDIETIVIKSSLLPLSFSLHHDFFDKAMDAGFSEREVYSFVENYRNFYLEHWDYVPIERLADYNSHKTMATIFKEIGTMPGISYYECLRLCETYLRGYKDGNVPTKFYLEQIGSNSWAKIDDMGKNLDLESRLSLGLSITSEEYNNLVDTTNSLRALVLK
ncbi:MAG: hypothetical protein K2J20_04245, partial [Bacilli bacterium]|nr:hypothetical protein [Bacilli bacterium]